MDEDVRKPMTFLAVIFIAAGAYLFYGRVTASQVFQSDFNNGKDLGHVEFKGETASLVYKVQPGDTWWKIAKDHDVSTHALLDANVATIGTPLNPGQNIHLPGVAAPPVTTPHP